MTAPSCRDCKHCSVRKPTNSGVDVCRMSPMPIRGEFFYCGFERALPLGMCGPNAILFEAKTRPWWKFWSRA